MTFDELAPSHLIELQTWFGKTICQKYGAAHFSAQAKKYIRASKTLTSEQRIELYHKQYWWRLLQCLRENFPFLTRLLGENPFNERIGIPYLTEHPPHTWALCELGDTLSDWLEENAFSYPLIVAAKLDFAAQESFWMRSAESVDFGLLSQNEILSTEVTLQPHIHLLEFEGDFLHLREEVMKEGVEYWQNHPLPELRVGKSYGVVYRNRANVVTCKELSQAEFLMLQAFKRGASITSACEELQSYGEGVTQEAEIGMPFWFREWIALEWFMQ